MGTLNGAGDDAGCHSYYDLGVGYQVCVQISQHSHENNDLRSTDDLHCQRLPSSSDKECKCRAPDNHRGNPVNIGSVHWNEKKENTLTGVAVGRKSSEMRFPHCICHMECAIVISTDSRRGIFMAKSDAAVLYPTLAPATKEVSQIQAAFMKKVKVDSDPNVIGSDFYGLLTESSQKTAREAGQKLSVRYGVKKVSSIGGGGRKTFLCLFQQESLGYIKKDGFGFNSGEYDSFRGDLSANPSEWELFDFVFGDKADKDPPEFYEEETTLDIPATSLDEIRGEVLIVGLEDTNRHFTSLTEGDFDTLKVCMDIVPSGAKYIMVCNLEEEWD